MYWSRSWSTRTRRIFCFHLWKLESHKFSVFTIFPGPSIPLYSPKWNPHLKLVTSHRCFLNQWLVFKILFGFSKQVTDSQYHSSLHPLGILLTLSRPVVMRRVLRGVGTSGTTASNMHHDMLLSRRLSRMIQEMSAHTKCLVRIITSKWPTTTKWYVDQDTSWYLTVTWHCHAHTSSPMPCQIPPSMSNQVIRLILLSAPRTSGYWRLKRFTLL